MNRWAVILGSEHPVAPLFQRIVIVGYSPSGLTAASGLAKAGHRITTPDNAPVIGEVGAGIQVSPNASRLLIRWSLGKALESIEFRRCKLDEDSWLQGIDVFA